MIENVQMRATKLVDGFGSLEYSERLQRLNLPTLLHRRTRGAMIELFKHFTVYPRETLPDAFQPRERCTRSHNLQIMDRKPKDGITGNQAKYFYYKYARIWNALPSTVVSANNLNTFKNCLNKHWESA